ncbi:hypothetical protein D3C81_692230 [compost metagenome]
MKISSKIGNALFVAAVVFGGAVFAGECKTDRGWLLSHELKAVSNLICITYDDNDVVMSVYQLGELGALVAKNTKFLDVADIAEGGVRVEPSGDGFKIYLEYPKNIYVVGFGMDAAFVFESFTQIKLDAIEAGGPPQHIKLELDSNVMAGLRFETLTISQAFDQSALRLGHPLSTRITALKANVSLLPNALGLPTQYLERGDKVEIIGFHSGWVEISYQGNNHQVDGWIPMVDIL